MCMISSLFTRNTAVQERIRGLPDPLKCDGPWIRSQVSSNRPCDTSVGRGVDDVAQRLVESGQCAAGAM
eukprot:8909286-Pyramimonas_sp.AAC.1